MILYLFCLVSTNFDHEIERFSGDRWHQNLLFPLLTSYLILIHQPIKQVYERSVVAFRSLLNVRNESHKHILQQAIGLNRRHEWQALAAGTLIGWIILQPWQDLFSWITLYELVSGGLAFGLTGWTAYSLFARSLRLVHLYQQTSTTWHRRSTHSQPLFWWAKAVLLTILGSMVMVMISIPARGMSDLLSTSLYIVLVLAILLIFFLTNQLLSVTTPVYRSRFRYAFLLILVVAISGTMGYYYLEDWTLLDGLYMTIITMTTIGYGEVNPLSETGRIFTIMLSISTIGIAGYSLSTVAAYLIEGEFNRVFRGRRMDKQIASLNNHVILCGVGRIGTAIASEFYKTNTPFVLVDQDMEAIEHILRMGDIPYLEGDATTDETLMTAGIERAIGLVAALNDDKENAFVVLTARSLNANLRIVARLSEEENAAKLRKAGADEIVSTAMIGGQRMASMMIRPSVVSFLDEMMRTPQQTLRMEEIHVTSLSSLVNQTLGHSHIGRRTGLLVIAVRSREGEYYFNPGAQTVLRDGDILIVLGTREQIKALQKLECDEAG